MGREELNIIFMDGGRNGRGYSDRWPESRVTIKCDKQRREEETGREWTDDRWHKGVEIFLCGGTLDGNLLEKECKKPLPHLKQGGTIVSGNDPRPFLYLPVCKEWAEKNSDIHTGINTEKSI